MSPTMPIELDRLSSEPLYRQVATSLRRAIDGGRLRPGQRVASVRLLATQLGVGRLTVATAYEQLAAEGYLVGRVGFGTIVAPEPPTAEIHDPPFGPRPRAPNPAPVRLPQLRALPATRHAADVAASQPGAVSARFDLRSSAAAGWSGARSGGGGGREGEGGLAVGAALERLLRDEFRRVAERGGGEIEDPAGDARLRAVIAAHLRATRAARCEPEQVVVLSGAVIGFGVIGRLWLGEGRRLAVEDPGDPQVRRALLASGGQAVGVAVDRHGLRADLLPDAAEIVAVAPTVHSPTGATMPLARRLRLLAWATARGALIVEDGRLDDFLLRATPQPCLQGLDNDGRVVHLGSFETLLHGGIRTAYAVLPPSLVEPFVAGLEAFDPGASPVQQRALGRFLADGLLDRHVARVRRVLLDRQRAALASIERELGWLGDAHETSGGTRLIVTIEDPAWTATDVVRVAAEAGIAIDSLAPARVQPALDRELVVDYGRLEPLELRSALRFLARALRAAVRSRPAPAPAVSAFRGGLAARA
jgi:GntR family transcriptional regulator / MocR family aminotransferase